jgi:menaquinone-dependent protoporphyrinogen oxidase
MILVACASKHGATREIARRIADRLMERGLAAEACGVTDVRGLEDAEAVVLGSAVYAGSWRKEAVDFVEEHADRLAHLQVWLFSSGPLGDRAIDEEEEPRQLNEIRQRVSPQGHRIFSGAVDMRKLSFGERMIMKAVKAPEGDFRDWADIQAWADEIADVLVVTTSSNGSAGSDTSSNAALPPSPVHASPPIRGESPGGGGTIGNDESPSERAP